MKIKIDFTLNDEETYKKEFNTLEEAADYLDEWRAAIESADDESGAAAIMDF